jgi:DNA-binding HxlR family transcriptional regulator
VAQALSTLAPIGPIQDGRRIEGGLLERDGAGSSGPILVERNALRISSRDRTKIAASAQSALSLIRGKWKIPILAQMIDRPVRLGQLRRLIPHASKKVLVQHLHELERDGIIERTDLSGKIKHVEYTISGPLGAAVLNLVGFLSDWEIRDAQRAPLETRTLAATKRRLRVGTGGEITVRRDTQPCGGSNAPRSRARPLVSTR